jgi:ubiquinone/menaquinone biosynthesis C-methylase UbiE
MLAQAEQQAIEDNVSGRFRIHQADVRDIAGPFPPSHFDLVVCHNVLQYIEDVTALLTEYPASFWPVIFKLLPVKYDNLR